MTRPLHIGNVRIWTGRPERPSARSITVEAGRVAVLDGPAPAGADVRDGRGCTVVPGLIDAHVHLLLGGRSLARLDLSGVRSRESFEHAIAERSAALAPDDWLLAGGWSQENWGGALPDKSWLAAAGARPAVCYRTDLHAALVNDAVLERCDLSRADAGDGDWGGRIERDPASGAPTGLMVEAAAWQIVNPALPAPDPEESRRAVLAAQEHVFRHGLTTVGSMEYRRDVEAVFRALGERLRLRCRITMLDRTWPLDLDYAQRFPNDERLAVIGSKAFIDGTFGSRSARMLEDWSDDPGNRGLLVELAAEGRLGDWIRVVVQAGLSPSMHAIGDEAARLALDALEQVASEAPDLVRRARPRIEHAQQLDPADVPRFASVIASMQPLHRADDGRYARRRVGDRRLAGTFAFRSLLDAGALLAFGSDWPVVACDPLAGIRAAVTGLTGDDTVFMPEQNLTVGEALTAYTAGAAHALGLDDAGTLAIGALGDLVVLSHDPFSADWAHDPPRVEMTVVGGEVVFGGRD